MRVTPRFMGWTYCFIGALFTFFAIQNVKLTGWTFLTYFLIGLATVDFMIALRFFANSRKKDKK